MSSRFERHIVLVCRCTSTCADQSRSFKDITIYIDVSAIIFRVRRLNRILSFIRWYVKITRILLGRDDLKFLDDSKARWSRREFIGTGSTSSNYRLRNSVAKRSDFRGITWISRRRYKVTSLPAIYAPLSTSIHCSTRSLRGER